MRFLALLTICCLACATQAQSISANKTDGAARVVLAGNTRPEATAQNDRGPLPDSFAMTHMQLLLRWPGEAAFSRYTGELTDPASPKFHRWLTPAQIGARFGLSDSQIAVVTRWLRAQGFVVNRVSANRAIVDFSGNAGEVRRAFGTSIHALSVGGVRHFANMRDPEIPAALAGLVEGIVSLNDFAPESNFRASPLLTQPCSQGSCYPITPADLAIIYDFTTAFANNLSGKGETIALIETSDLFAQSDWSRFRSVFSLNRFGSATLTVTHPAPAEGSNNCTDPGVTKASGEAILDIEWASAAAPAANLVFASCKNTATPGAIIAVENVVNNSATPPDIISISFGECEAKLGNAQRKALSRTFQSAIAEGTSVYLAAGDSSGAACDAHQAAATHGMTINGYAANSFATVVGGTDFGDTFANANSTYWTSTNTSKFSSAISYIPEIPWNGSCASSLRATFLSGSARTFGKKGFCNSAAGAKFLTVNGGAGGASCCAGQPRWQKNVIGIPANGKRNIPDVAMFASEGGTWKHSLIFCNSQDLSCAGTPASWSHGGGTSFAAPIWAGIQALIDQSLSGRQGNASPILYRLARQEYGEKGKSACKSIPGASGKHCVFHDVVEGDNDVNCTGTIDCFRRSGTYGVLSLSKDKYEPAFRAGVGWDFATGLGTPDVGNLVAAWKALVSPRVASAENHHLPHVQVP